MVELWNNQINQAAEKAVLAAIQGRHISEGSIVKELEDMVKDILQIPYALAAPNGTSALALAFLGADVQPGDEVIVPDITFVATANAAKLLGAKVIIADTQKEVPLLDIEMVKDLITEKTKVIVPVDLNGRRVQIDEIRKIIKGRDIIIVDDACQAFMSGEQGNYAGTDADIGCYSFGITKTVTTGQGGMVVTKNQKLYEKMKCMKLQGVDSIFSCADYKMPGFNFKMTDILASIGIEQLKCLKEKIEREWEIYHLYYSELKDLSGISMVPRKEKELPWMMEIMCEDRENIMKILAEHEIVSRPIGACLHRAKHFTSKGEYPNALNFEKKYLFLPSGPDQDIQNVKQVIRVLKESFSN